MKKKRIQAPRPFCKIEGCLTYSVSGRERLCRKHGGGHRCKIEGCKAGALNKFQMLCGKHGGGPRCRIPNCLNASIRRNVLLCKKHGGGPRCKIRGCTRSAYKPTILLCVKHGGGPECRNCDKNALFSKYSKRFCNFHLKLDKFNILAEIAHQKYLKIKKENN